VTDHRTLKPYAVEVSVLAGHELVWEAVTQPAVLRQWFGWDYDGLDTEIQHIFVDEATLWAPERMGWADGSFLEVQGDDDTSVVRAAREGGPPANTDEYDAIEEGWRAFLVQLQFLLELRPRGRRRTLYLTGETTGRQALSLVDGEWRRSGSRVAWTVDPDGFLVVVAGRMPLDSPGAAAMHVVVSTYGLDDATFDGVRAKWAQRWVAVAGGAQVTYAAMPAPG
jgi:hypothetical protein